MALIHLQVLRDCGIEDERDWLDALDLYNNKELFAELTELLSRQGFDGLITNSENTNWGDVILFSPKDCIKLAETLSTSAKNAITNHIHEQCKLLLSLRPEDLLELEPPDNLDILNIPGLQCHYGTLWTVDSVVPNDVFACIPGCEDWQISDKEKQENFKERLLQFIEAALENPTKCCWQDIRHLKSLYKKL